MKNFSTRTYIENNSKNASLIQSKDIDFQQNLENKINELLINEGYDKLNVKNITISYLDNDDVELIIECADNFRRELIMLTPMPDECIHLAHPAPFKEIKEEIEEELGFSVRIHPNNNQLAYFEATDDIDLFEIENKITGYDVIVIPDDLLEEYI